MTMTTSTDNDECHFSYGQLVISLRSQWNSLRSNLPKYHYYYGQLVISFRSKWNSLRSNFDRTVNLFHALEVARTTVSIATFVAGTISSIQEYAKEDTKDLDDSQ